MKHSWQTFKDNHKLKNRKRTLAEHQRHPTTPQNKPWQPLDGHFVDGWVFFGHTPYTQKPLFQSLVFSS